MRSIDIFVPSRRDNGLQHKQGNATLYVRIWKNDKGEFHIVQVEQRNP